MTRGSLLLMVVALMVTLTVAQAQALGPDVKGGTGGNTDGQQTGNGTLVVAGGGGPGEGQGGVGVSDSNTGSTLFAAGGGASHANEESRDAWGGDARIRPTLPVVSAWETRTKGCTERDES
jgi:hypothetical protein